MSAVEWLGVVVLILSVLLLVVVVALSSAVVLWRLRGRRYALRGAHVARGGRRRG